MTGLAMKTKRCLNCSDHLDAYTNEDYCSRECLLEAMYDNEITCKSCDGTGQGVETAAGEWAECRRCYGTGYLHKVK